MPDGLWAFQRNDDFVIVNKGDLTSESKLIYSTACHRQCPRAKTAASLFIHQISGIDRWRGSDH